MSNQSTYTKTHVTFNDFDAAKMGFKEPKPGMAMGTFSIPIQYEGGDFRICSPLLTSFGTEAITEKDPKTGKNAVVNEDGSNIVGYKIPLLLHSKPSPTQEELDFMRLMDGIVESSKAYLCSAECNTALGRTGNKRINEQTVSDIDPRWFKYHDDGVTVRDDIPPRLYAKLPKDRNGKYFAKFFPQENGINQPKHEDPTLLLKMPMRMAATIKIESIFIGPVIKLQVKIHEAAYIPQPRGYVRVLPVLPENPVALAYKGPAETTENTTASTGQVA